MTMIYHMLTLLLLCLSVISTTAVNVTIGGFFSIYDAANHIDVQQSQCLHAFLLAVSELNTKHILKSNITFDYVIRTVNTIREAVILADEFSTLSGVVGALPYPETSAIDQAFADSKTVMVHSLASNTDFGNGLKYPYKIQTCPVDSYQGMIIQNMMCTFFNFSRVVIFATNDEFGNKAAIESGDGSYCDIQNLGTFLFPSYTTDFSSYIQKAANLEASVFLLFTSSKNAAMLMEQGYDQGLFRDGTQILGSSNLLSPSLFEYFSSTADVPSIMKGVIAIQYWPSYEIDMYGSSLDFVNNFKSQTFNGNCSSAVDASGYHYLFPSGDTSLSCTNLNFSSINKNGSDIDPYAALTYDAMYTLAYGLDEVVLAGQSINGDNLLKAIFDNVSFVGVTGNIKFYEGMTNYNYYARGDREVGHHYRIMNFNADAYASNPNNSFVQVMVWSVEDGVQPCDSWMSCSDVIYSTLDNSMPSCYPPYTFAEPPNVIKIGGLFSPVDNYGNVDIVEAENLAAFLMAIQEINNKTDGVADDILPNTQLKFTIETGRGFDGAVTSAEHLVNSFFHTGVNGVICGLPDMETLATDQLLGDHGIVQVHSMATDTNFGSGDRFPYKIQTCPIDSYQGMVLQNIICTYFAYTKVTIFATNDIFGSRASMEAVDGTFCGIEVLSTHMFRSDTKDFSALINLADSVGAQVFLLFMGAENAANLLEQGHNHGLFHEGTQVFSSNFSMGAELFRHFSSDANVPAILKGFIGIQYWPDYSATRSQVGRDFVKRWRQQPYTGRAIRHFENVCDVSKDDADSSFLYTSQSNQSLCAGLNFTSYDVNGTTINPYAGLTYDATYVLARGLHVVVESGWEVNGNNILRAIFDNISFDGASGKIKFFEGMSGFGNYARGDREVGHHYRIMNFNADAYAADPNNSFVQVMVWSAEDGVQPCDSMTSCSDIIYNTVDGLPAKDTPPDVIVVLTTGGKGVLFFFASLVFCAAIASFFVVVKYRGSKLMKASQFELMGILIFGGFLGGIRVLVAGLPINNGNCTWGLWMGHLAFVCIVSPLFMKSYKLNHLFKTTGERKEKFSKRRVVFFAILFILFMIVYLIFLTFFGTPKAVENVSTVGNRTTREIRCSLSYPQVHTALFAIEAAFLLKGIHLSWSVKDFPDMLNEGKFIALIFSFLAMIGILVFPIVFVLPLSPPIQQIIASCSIAIGAVTTLTIYFGPKVVKLIGGGDIKGKSTKFNVKKEKDPFDMPAKGGAPIAPTNPGSGADPNSIVLASTALHKLSADEKVQICQDQIGKWRGMMVQVCEKTSGQSGSNSSTHQKSTTMKERDPDLIISNVEFIDNDDKSSVAISH